MMIVMVLETAGEFLMGTTSEFVARPFVLIRLRFFNLSLFFYFYFIFYVALLGYSSESVSIFKRPSLFVKHLCPFLMLFEDSSWEACNGSGCCRLAEGHEKNGPRCQASRLCCSSKLSAAPYFTFSFPWFFFFLEFLSKFNHDDPKA